MRILVTGGAGFIGSHLVDALIKRGHQVHIWDDLSSGFRAFVHPKARLHSIDIASPAAERAAATLKPQVVFHLAAQKDVRLSVEDPVFDATVNVIGLLRLVTGLRKAGGVKKFIFASTGGAIYGGAEKIPTPEETSAQPFSPYGASKLASEAYLGAYRTTGLLPAVSLRFANVYGPRQTAKSETGVIAVWAERLLAGERPVVYGDGKQTRDFVYVGDVVRALLLGMTRRATGAVNIGTGRETSLNTLLSKMTAVVGEDLRPMYAPAKPGEERRSCLSPRRAKTLLGWTPHMSLEHGLEQSIAWMRTWQADAGKGAHGHSSTRRR